MNKVHVIKMHGLNENGLYKQLGYVLDPEKKGVRLLEFKSYDQAQLWLNRQSATLDKNKYYEIVDVYKKFEYEESY